MTRIVGGAAKGRHLAVPPHGTRPTSDRAREALFNTLVGLLDIEGARMLDLLEPYQGHRARVLRLLLAAGIEAPRFGPKMPVRSIARW